MFFVNLAQIRSVVSEIFHTQTNKSSAVAEMGDRFATVDKGRDLGAGYLF